MTELPSEEERSELELQLEAIARHRDELLRQLESSESNDLLLYQFSLKWNRWCAQALRARKPAIEANMEEEWREITCVTLRDALKHSLVGFEFPGEVWLKPEIWPCRFGAISEKGRTVFHGAFHAGGLTFDGRSNFKWCKFLGPARFGDAYFRARVDFSHAEFRCNASFVGARFEDDAWFAEADFHGDAAFARCSFAKNAWFDRCRIGPSGKAAFRACRGAGRIFFFGARIEGILEIQESTCDEAIVLAAVGEGDQYRPFHATGSVSLRHTHTKRLVMEDARFDRVPDFVGMHVDGPVELDLVEIGEEPPEDVRNLPPRQRAAELTARWRALKRLAEQGHHHYYTALFARNEMRARELLDREQRPLAAWLGRVYGALSDYGLSLWRPWAWWLLTLLVATLAYWDGHVRALGVPPFTACAGSGPGNAFWSSLLFALRQGSVFGNLASIPGSEWVVDCLYGERVPAAIIVFAGLQSAVSAVLLFLFLLAVRNHFRIR